MCTVTFIKTDQGVVLTSNRDERTRRSTLAPKSYSVGSKRVSFPKDEEAGGTWIALGDNGVFCCLLNGGFNQHVSKGNYRRSRGQIVLDVFRMNSPETFLDVIDLENIEPFTLILYNSKEDKLLLLVWDEIEKHIKELDANTPHFWASASLYSKEVSLERRKQFYNYIDDIEEVGSESIYELHSRSREQQGYILSAISGIETVSITQLILNQKKGTMIYNVLSENIKTVINKSWEKVSP